MDPQEEIAAFLRGKGVQRAVINDMLRGFAHDLAEAIRRETEQHSHIAELDDRYFQGWVAGSKSAADLIDPEVT